MNIYVFEDVLTDYTSGMAVVSAESLEQARELVLKEIFGGNTGMLNDDLGFTKPTGVYPTTAAAPGVLHYVYGGA